MAQFVGPKHRLYQVEVERVAEPRPAVAAPAAGEAPVAEDRAWFDSSWALRKGLDVAELPGFPPEAPGPAGTD
jgi:hypothetical protein